MQFDSRKNVYANTPQPTDKPRIEFIDLAKGLLIILVVAGHVSMAFDGSFGDDPFVRGMHWFFQNWVNTFFMPAFFVITGYCTNFGKRFRDYLLSAVISLKMPVFFFIGVLGALAIRPLFGFSPFSPYWWGIRLFESGLWFLHAMFLVKIAYWFVCRMANTAVQTVIVLLLYAIGVGCIIQGLADRFWVLHALMLMPFIHLGRCIKNIGFTKPVGTASLGSFVLLSSAILLGGGKMPGITQTIVCEQFWHPVAILLLASTGAVAFVWLCQYVKYTRLLSFIGKYSLVIYCVHGPELGAYFLDPLPALYIDCSAVIALNYIIRTSLLIALCLLVAVLLDRPYLRVFIGKRP